MHFQRYIILPSKHNRSHQNMKIVHTMINFFNGNFDCSEVIVLNVISILSYFFVPYTMFSFAIKCDVY